MTTRRDLLRRIGAPLEPLYGPAEARQIALSALSARTGIAPAALLADPGAPLDLPEADTLADELAAGRPLQYVLGFTDFCGLRIGVREGVLIPRPETEELVAWIAAENPHARRLLDVGTGSGCIALALKHLLPAATVCGADLSSEALAIARANAAALGLDVGFHRADALRTPRHNAARSNMPPRPGCTPDRSDAPATAPLTGPATGRQGPMACGIRDAGGDVLPAQHVSCFGTGPADSSAKSDTPTLTPLPGSAAGRLDPKIHRTTESRDISQSSALCSTRTVSTFRTCSAHASDRPDVPAHTRSGAQSVSAARNTPQPGAGCCHTSDTIQVGSTHRQPNSPPCRPADKPQAAAPPRQHSASPQAALSVVTPLPDPLFMEAPALSDVFPGPFDVVVSNPPYIPASERASMRRNVTDYEPGQALFVPDDDPLRFYRAIASTARCLLAPGGALYFEIHERYGEAVCQLLSEAGFAHVELRHDFRGKPRMIRARKPTAP